MQEEHIKAIDYLNKVLENHISTFRTKREKNRSKAYIFQIVLLLMGLITSILLGIKISAYKELFYNFAFILSCCTTTISSIELFFNPRSLWIRYTETLTTLYSIQSDLKFQAVLYENSLEKIDFQSIHNRIQNALSDTNSWWKTERNNNQINRMK